MIKISNNLKIGKKHSPKIIAEISGNHSGSKSNFLKLIKSACMNGADLIKIQTYEPKDITLNKINSNFKIKNGIWKGKFLWDLYKQAHTPFSWHKDAFKLAAKYNKIIFSSPFSKRAVDLLEQLECKLYKIASFEITDFKLIDYIASKKKPIILSTGMASNKEIKDAISLINNYHKNIILLHCVSSYPTDLSDINLKKINKLKKMYKGTMIGLSDHTNDIISSIASIPYEVVAIEKHFKLNDQSKSADSSFSITPEKLKILKSSTEKLILSQKKIHFNSEKISKKLRRSIFAKTHIRKNEKITLENIDTFRPFVGICASKFFKVLGKKVKKNIKKDSPIFYKDIS